MTPTAKIRFVYASSGTIYIEQWWSDYQGIGSSDWRNEKHFEVGEWRRVSLVKAEELENNG